MKNQEKVSNAQLKAENYNLNLENEKLSSRNENLSAANKNLIEKLHSSFTSFYDEPNYDKLLFMDNDISFPFGITSITGYIIELEIEDQDYGYDKNIYPFFVCVEMDETLENYYSSLIDEGNLINKRIDKYLAISIDYLNIDESLFENLKKTNENNLMTVFCYLNQMSISSGASPAVMYLLPLVIEN